MRRALLATAVMFLAGTAGAHEIADIKMSISAPAFVAARQPFSYRIIADNVANDSALDVVVTTTLPSSLGFTKASGDGWSCAESNRVVTCSAEEVGSGPSLITIDVTAPSESGLITASVTVESLGSLDPNAANDHATATTTIYDPARCPTPKLLLVQPDDPVASPAHLSWTSVPNATSYAIYGSVEGERSALLTTTKEIAITLPFERGNVAWHVEAILGPCPTASSETGHFLSAGRPAALTVTNFAGDPRRAGAADGSVAEATFRSPAGVTVDNGGNLFITDSESFTIREISAGQVTTPAGTPSVSGSSDGRPGGFASPMGIVYSPADDFLVFTDRGNHLVRLRYPGDRQLGYVLTIGGLAGQPGMVDGLFEVSRLSSPSAIAADPRGKLYVADSGNHRIRRMTAVPDYIGYYEIATFAGSSEGAADGATASALFRNPAGVAVDGEEIVYVADTGNHTIRKIENGVVTTLAGAAGSPGSADGYGAAARFNAPTAIVADARGNLYVCDTGNHTIRKVSPSGLVTTVAGLAGAPGHSDGAGGSVRLSSPGGIAIDASGTIYIADTGNHRIAIAHVAVPSGNRRRAALP